MRLTTLGGGARNGMPEHALSYRWRGQEDWDPAALGPMRAAQAASGGRVAQKEGREARIAEFDRLRAEEGKTVAEAAALLDVTRDTGNEYERVLRQRKAARS